MGIRDRLSSSLEALVAAPAQAPSPAPAVEARADASDGSARYMGSIYNSMTGYGGQGDKGTAARPNTYRQGLQLDELEALYNYNGYAARVVNQLPDDGTRKGWVVKDDDGESDPLADEYQRLGVFAKFADAWRWARLYGGAGILIVTDDAEEDKRKPLRVEALREIKNLAVLDAWEISPASYETNPEDPQYRQVATWYVQPSGRSANITAEVHASRLLYFWGRKLSPSQRWSSQSGLDQSILDLYWDAVRNLTSVDQGGASIAQQFMVGVLKMLNLGAKQAGDQRANFIERIALLAKTMSALNMVVLAPEEDYATQSTSLSGWGELSAQARLALAAVEGMPQTLLFGETPGGLSTDGESHRKIWASIVSAGQAFCIRPQATYLTELIYAQTDGPTKGQAPDKWTLEFLPLDEPTRKEQADTEKVHAETDVLRINAGVVDPEHVARSRFGAAGYQDALLAIDEDELEAREEDDPEAEADARAMIADAEDAADPAALCLLIPVPPAGLEEHAAWKAKAEAIVGPLTHEDPPHVTVLYLGMVPEGFDADVAEIAHEVAESFEPTRLTPGGTMVLGDAVVLRHNTWDLDRLHGRLLQALAHLVTAKQYPTYRPHETLGYSQALTPEAAGRVLELQAEWGEDGPKGWVASRLELRRGGKVVATLPFLGKREDGDPAAEE
jgi:uncharacterized protein